MGYRSEVLLAIELPSKQAMYEFVAIAKAGASVEVIEAINDYGMYAPEHTENVAIIAHYDHVKWYNSFSDVQAHDHILELASEMRYPTLFLRIGEDADDVENRWVWGDSGVVEATLLYDMDIVRHIDTPADIKPIELPDRA